MKILQVVPFFHHAYAFGGPIKVAFQVSRDLVKREHDVIVWTSDAKDRDSRLTLEPIYSSRWYQGALYEKSFYDDY